VWEFIESEEAVAIVFQHRHKGATVACKELIAESARRWKEEEGDYRDDITAVVLFLPIIERLQESFKKEPGSFKKSKKGRNSADIHGSFQTTTVFDTSNKEVNAVDANDSMNRRSSAMGDDADGNKFVPDPDEEPAEGAGAHRSPDGARQLKVRASACSPAPSPHARVCPHTRTRALHARPPPRGVQDRKDNEFTGENGLKSPRPPQPVAWTKSSGGIRESKLEDQALPQDGQAAEKAKTFLERRLSYSDTLDKNVDPKKRADTSNSMAKTAASMASSACLQGGS
jgi:hypothetical protein